MAQSDVSQEQQDEALLRKFGYRQELRRTLGFLSNFAVAFSYISVSTGTFALFFLGLAAGGPAFFWTWPIVAIGQFIVAWLVHRVDLLLRRRYHRDVSSIYRAHPVPWDLP